MEPLRIKLKTPEIRTIQSFSKGVYGCRFHFAELLSFVDAPLAGSKAACTTLANILLKAHVLNVSDKEKSGMPQEARQAIQLMIGIDNVVIDIVL